MVCPICAQVIFHIADEIPVRPSLGMNAMVILVMGTCCKGTPAQTSCHRPLRRSPCNLLTPFATPARSQCQNGHADKGGGLSMAVLTRKIIEAQAKIVRSIYRDSARTRCGRKRLAGGNRRMEW